jgi:hypothetical protein
MKGTAKFGGSNAQAFERDAVRCAGGITRRGETVPELRADWISWLNRIAVEMVLGSPGVLGVQNFYPFVFNIFLGSNRGAKFLKGSFLREIHAMPTKTLLDWPVALFGLA